MLKDNIKLLLKILFNIVKEKIKKKKKPKPIVETGNVTTLVINWDDVPSTTGDLEGNNDSSVQCVTENSKDINMKEIIINNSKAENFHKQTNNQRSPFISCFPTSMINAGETVGIKFPTSEDKTGGYSQEEDAYDWFLHTNSDVVSFWNKPAYKGTIDTGIDPREIWDVEFYAFKKWAGTENIKISYNVKVSEIVDTIKNGGAVVTSGKFCGLGHVVCIVGLKAESEDINGITEDNVKEFIIDDSYGNPHNKYKPAGVGGNDVVWNKNDFLKCISKPGNKYYGILFSK